MLDKSFKDNFLKVANREKWKASWPEERKM